MEKLKSSLTLFMIDFVAMTIYFGGMLRTTFNADTITYMVYPLGDIDVEICDGRYLIALFDIILYKLGTKTTDVIPLSILFTLIFIAASITILQKIFRKFLKSDNIFIVSGFYCALGLTFANVLFSEYLMFPEVSVFYAIGFLFVTAGAYYQARNKKLPAFILFAAGACIYQITLVYAAIILLFYYMLSNDFKWSKQAVIEEFLACFLPLSTGVLNMLALRVVGIINPTYAFRRTVTSEPMTNKIPQLFASLMDFMKNSYTLLPSLHLPALFFALFILGTIILLVRSKDIPSILYFCLVLVISLGVLFAIPLLETEFTFPPRMSFCLYLIQGLLMITFMSELSTFDRLPSLKAAAVSIFLYAWIQMIFCSYIISGRYVSNALDLVNAGAVLREIENYEAETGITVVYLEELHDSYAPAFYEESRTHYDQINEKIFGQTTRAYIEAMFGRKFIESSVIPEDITEYFAGKDWDYFDVKEQMVFKGDSAYLCLY